MATHPNSVISDSRTAGGGSLRLRRTHMEDCPEASSDSNSGGGRTTSPPPTSSPSPTLARRDEDLDEQTNHITNHQDVRDQDETPSVLIPELQPRQPTLYSSYSFDGASLTKNRTDIKAETSGGNSTAAEASTSSQEGSIGNFDCNICFDTVAEPVVTVCGHLFCWTCLAQALSRVNDTCPVCKSGVDPKKGIIPIYGRGKEQVDPRKKKPLEELIKEFGPRPSGQQSTAPSMQQQQQRAAEQFFNPWTFFGGGSPVAGAGAGGGPQVAFSAGLFPFFPGFGITMNFGGSGIRQPQQQEERTNQTSVQQQQQLISRLFFFVGLFVLFVLLVPAPY